MKNFIDYLYKKEELTLEQMESLRFFLDLELRDFIIRSGAFTRQRILYRWEKYIEQLKDERYGIKHR